jgi:ribulose-5-phosphate 4-epimerase/fuculose-1-phosphate aldolase
MDCDQDECPERGFCHLRCPRRRLAAGVPIVPGEVGTGRYGLCRTVPPVLQEHPAAIVYGHGVFAAGGEDFNDAFGRLLAIENGCREEYFRRVAGR